MFFKISRKVGVRSLPLNAESGKKTELPTDRKDVVASSLRPCENLTPAQTCGWSYCVNLQQNRILRKRYLVVQEAPTADILDQNRCLIRPTAIFCLKPAGRPGGLLVGIRVTFWQPGHGFESRREWVCSHLRTW